MKKIITSFLVLITVIMVYGQRLDNINSGEVLTYRVHYGPLTAGSATLSTKLTNFQGKQHLYVRGEGKTSGAVNAFFKVNDLYESFINYETELPSYYVRNVQEGSYSQHLQTVFNHNNQTLILTDRKNGGSKTLKSVRGVQDMLSAFYHLRSMDQSELKIGSVRNLNVWISDEMYPFSLKVVGVETLRTKFGKISCLKIIPMVQSGRVFKAKEGVTLWVSNDRNHIPVSIKAELAVGSLKADLNSYKNVKYNLAFSK